MSKQQDDSFFEAIIKRLPLGDNMPAPELGNGSMRRKGVIRTATLKKYVEEKRISAAFCVETEGGIYHLVVRDHGDNVFFLTTYRSGDVRSFSSVSGVWSHCKKIGITRLVIVKNPTKEDYNDGSIPPT